MPNAVDVKSIVDSLFMFQSNNGECQVSTRELINVLGTDDYNS